jgi:hypothetical protein
MRKLAKYSVVRPEGSLTPPPNIVLDVLCTWGVREREFADWLPPFLTVFP